MNPILNDMPVSCGENLVMRVARPEDAGEIVDFNTRIFDERITHWTADLISGKHPTVRTDDFTVVEDTTTGRIVSSACLISQTWRYGGIPFKVGRPELIATDPAYRRRGLVRKQIEALHSRSAAKGELMQVITGVDWFYRQFGYEMGIRMWGSRCLDSIHLQALRNLETQPCGLRAAGPADSEFIEELFEIHARKRLFSAVRTKEEWGLEFTGRSKANTRRREWWIVESPEGGRLGFVQYLPCLALPHLPMFRIYQIELIEGANYLNLAPSLLRGMWEKGLELQANGELACDELRGLELTMEREHPLFHAIPKWMLRELKPSPWYVRIPDMRAFLLHLRPALERHLEGTLAEGYSGELKLNFYRGGMRIVLDRGRITAIEDWRPDEVWQGDVKLPGTSFQQLVCGWRRFHDLTECFPDCWGAHHVATLLDCLFPAYHGKVWVLA